MLKRNKRYMEYPKSIGKMAFPCPRGNLINYYVYIYQSGVCHVLHFSCRLGAHI